MGKRKMANKYIFFCGTLSAGGAERVISSLAGRMCGLNIDVDILTYYDTEAFYELNPAIRVIHAEKETGSRNIIRNIMWIRKYVKRSEATAIISFLAPFNMLMICATLFLKTAVIVADRNDPRYIPAKGFVRRIRNLLYSLADGVVLQTKHNQSYFGNTIQKKSKVIYNPVNIGDKVGLALRTAKRKEIVSVGRLMPQKNQKMLIEAFSQLHTQFPEHKLVIYGEGSGRSELEKYIAELGLEEYVLLPGKFLDIHERISAAELFVLSSDYEGMPNALMEAMCLGLPVISTEVSGATDLIENEVNGLLVSCRDKDGLVLSMSKILSDRNYAKVMAEKAVLLADGLEIDKIADEWIGFINRIKRRM